MKQILLTFLLIGSLLIAKAQKAGETESLISGHVQDENGQALAYATIRVFLADTSHEATSEKIADEQGNFKITRPTNSRYWLKATQTGFENYAKWISPEQTTCNISMEKNETQLSTVTVSSTKPTITRKIDRVVMNVEDNALTAGKSSLEIMDMAPGMFVDRDGGISINGNTGTRIMINGKMLHLSGDDLTAYLNNLRASDIKSIEIIAHPSAEFDAEGSGGIINIILKQHRTAGLSGSVNAGYSKGRYAGNDQGMQLDYHSTKLTLFSSYSHYQDRSFNDITQDRKFPEEGHYAAVNNIVNHYNGSSVRLGGTYDITPKQYVGLEYSGSFNIGGSETNSLSTITYPLNPSGDFTSDGLFTSHRARNLHNITGNYHIDIDTAGSKFDFTTDYTLTNNNITSLSQSQNLDDQLQIIGDTSYRYAMPNKAKILTIDAKYLQVFSPDIKLNFGAKYTGTQIDNDNHFYSVVNSNWKENPTSKYTYHYQENITAGFLSLETKLLQMNFQFGLRGEYTDTKGTLVSKESEEIRNHYFNLFPSVSIKKDIDSTGGNYLNFSYNRRIERPYYNDLNPYVSYLDNYTSETGNPFLKPQFSNSFELGFTLKNKYNLTVGYSKDLDVITEVTDANPDTSLIKITRGNVGYAQRFYTTLSLPIQITKWWKTNNTLQYRYDKIHSPEFTLQKPIYFLQSAHDFKITKTWSANLNAFYLSHIIEGNILINHISKIDIGIQKKLWEDRLSIRAGLTDLFEGRNMTADIKYNDNIVHITQKRQSRMLKVSLTYNFRSGKSFTAKKIQSSNDDEKSRLQ